MSNTTCRRLSIDYRYTVPEFTNSYGLYRLVMADGVRPVPQHLHRFAQRPHDGVLPVSRHRTGCAGLDQQDLPEACRARRGDIARLVSHHDRARGDAVEPAQALEDHSRARLAPRVIGDGIGRLSLAVVGEGKPPY